MSPPLGRAEIVEYETIRRRNRLELDIMYSYVPVIGNVLPGMFRRSGYCKPRRIYKAYAVFKCATFSQNSCSIEKGSLSDEK